MGYFLQLILFKDSLPAQSNARLALQASKGNMQALVHTIIVILLYVGYSYSMVISESIEHGAG